MERNDSTRPEAMAFYDPQGFVPAFKNASAFAGDGGKVATLPDIINARLSSAPGDYPWGTYFTTMSAEYVGRSAQGNPIAIVAHGVGPMSTLDGTLAAYGHQFKDQSRNRRGGRITRKEFLDLERGKYGDVAVIDLEATWRRRPYQFSGHPVTSREIMQEPLWQARLGQNWREYVKHHAKFARKYHHENGHPQYQHPCILGMDDASNCPYSDRELFEHQMEATPDTAIAHLLSIGGIQHSHHQYYEWDYEKRENRVSLANDVNCHEWSDGTRLVGIRSGCNVIHPGLPSYRTLMNEKLDLLWRENAGGDSAAMAGFWHLLRINGRFFTDYPKQGERMDCGEPEFSVVSALHIADGARVLRTAIGGYHGFFKYGIDEVKRIAPPGANAYTVDEVDVEYNDPNLHAARLSFYRVKADTTSRLVRPDDIYRDFDLMMKLID